MNKKQKIVIYIVAAIILSSFIVWLIYGGEIFTKTQIIVESKDELFGWTERKWVNKFVWGLDLSLLISGFSIVIGGIFLFVFRNKKQK